MKHIVKSVKVAVNDGIPLLPAHAREYVVLCNAGIAHDAVIRAMLLNILGKGVACPLSI
jgi:hypothetical protein